MNKMNDRGLLKRKHEQIITHLNAANFAALDAYALVTDKSPEYERYYTMLGEIISKMTEELELYRQVL
jgi:hypothetical protein